MYRYRTLNGIAVLAIICALVSCSAFKPATQTVTISASEPDAEIYVDGILSGRGEVTVDLWRNRAHYFRAVSGDREGFESVRPVRSVTGTLDILGTIFGVGIFGVYSPGFYDFDSDTVHVELTPTK